METNMRLNLLLVCVLFCTKRKLSTVRNYLQTQWANVFVFFFELTKSACATQVVPNHRSHRCDQRIQNSSHLCQGGALSGVRQGEGEIRILAKQLPAPSVVSPAARLAEAWGLRALCPSQVALPVAAQSFLSGNSALYDLVFTAVTNA